MEFATLASGSSGNCTLVTADGTALLIDAGISLRRITTFLRQLGTDVGDLAGVLVTHEHSDHVCALPMLCKYCHIPLYATPGTAEALRVSCPDAWRHLRELPPGETLQLGTLTARGVRTSHDAAESVGYVLTHGDRRLIFATDTGVVTEELAQAARGCDAAVLESNHDIELLRRGPYPYALKQRILSPRGHLSNDDCGVFAAGLVGQGTRRVVLAHLSRENNTPATALGTVSAALRRAGALPGRDVALDVAPMLGVLGPVEV